MQLNKKIISFGLSAILLLGSSGCASMVQKKVGPMLDGFVDSVMAQDDPELVREALPSYLLILDGVIASNPNNPEMLSAGAQLYSAFAGGFFSDTSSPRFRSMGSKAKNYAFRAMSEVNPTFKQYANAGFADFEKIGPTLTKEQQPYIGTLIMAWASYILGHMEDSDNYAALPKLNMLAERFLELDETYNGGMPHQVMGLLYSLVPAAVGGQPEKAKEHFERAIEISQKKDLSIFVTYANRYARATFNRQLHDELLQYVLDTPADIAPEKTLMNTMAKADAKALLDSSEEYFE